MGSKRPEQIRKDMQSTDFKTRTDDQRIHDQDKQRLHEPRGGLVEQGGTPPAPERDMPGGG